MMPEQMANEELDHYIAEHVMGWAQEMVTFTHGDQQACYVERRNGLAVNYLIAWKWTPTSDLECAGIALAKLAEREIIVTTEQWPDQWFVRIRSAYMPDFAFDAMAGTLAEAISRAIAGFASQTRDWNEKEGSNGRE